MRVLVSGEVSLRGSKLPGPCVRGDRLCHLSAAEAAAAQLCVGFRAEMMMVSGILHGRKVPLSTFMRVVPAIGQGETLLSAHFATAGQ